MSIVDVALMAHLRRRAGFGATRDELEAYVAKGYEATVEELLNPGNPESLPDDLIRRYHVDQSELRLTESAIAYRLYKMVTTMCPLEDKVALFWQASSPPATERSTRPRRCWLRQRCFAGTASAASALF